MLYLFRTHVMSLYDIETCFLKVHKKDLNIISVVWHNAIESICGCNFYNDNLECLDILSFSMFPSVFLCLVHSPSDHRVKYESKNTPIDEENQWSDILSLF